jgi:hypothetical protein
MHSLLKKTLLSLYESLRFIACSLIQKGMRLTPSEPVRCNEGGGVMIMMGLKAREFAPLAAITLEELVPQDHFYCHLQKTLDHAGRL